VAFRSRQIDFELPKREPEPAPMPPTPVSWVLAGICVLVLIANFFSPDDWVLRFGALFGPAVEAGQWWRVFTSSIVHANPVHLLFNLTGIWTLGRDLEVGIGKFRFIITTLLGVLGSALVVLVLNFDVPTVGISGVILAWGGAMVAIVGRTRRNQLLQWLGAVALISLFPQISFAGHLGGFLAGLPCGWVMRRGRVTFAIAAPVMLCIWGVLVYLAGTGRIGLGTK
jgi:membrane associated rhomboid family serine protease